MNLDDLLDSSAPLTVPRTASLERELDRMILDAESAARPGRRRLRLSAVSALSTVVIGIGAGGAMAAGLVPAPPWLPWTTPSGSDCAMQFTADAEPGSGTAEAVGLSAGERQRALVVANRFLDSFDYSSIDQAAAIRKWQEKEDAAIAAQPDRRERQPRLTGDDLALHAVGSEVYDQLRAHLAAHGHKPDAVNFTQTIRCGE